MISFYLLRMEYYLTIKKNELESFVEMQMDLESVIKSKKEKNKYCVLT